MFRAFYNPQTLSPASAKMAAPDQAKRTSSSWQMLRELAGSCMPQASGSDDVVDKTEC